MSRELQEGLLGCMLNIHEYRSYILNKVDRDYFPDLAVIYDEVKHQYEEGINFNTSTIKAKIGDTWSLSLQECEIHAYYTESQVEPAIHVLGEDAERKKLYRRMDSLHGQRDAKSVSQLLVEIGELAQSETATIRKSFTVSEILGREGTRKEKLHTGEYQMDSVLFDGAGTARGDVLTVSAESKHGKTQFVQYLVGKLACHGYKGAWFQLEDYDENTAIALFEHAQQYADNVLICDSIRDIDYIKRECMSIKHEYGLDFVVIDYIQIVSCMRGDSKTLQMEEICNVVKQIAKDLNCLVIITSQVSVAKDRFRWKRVPRVDDVKWAQAIKEASHAVVSVFRPNMVDDLVASYQNEPYIKDYKDELQPYNSVYVKKRADRRKELPEGIIHMIHTSEKGLQLYQKGY